MKFSDLTKKQQSIINKCKQDFYDNEDFADYKKEVLHALARKPVRKTFANSGLALEIRYILGSDGDLGLEFYLLSLTNKVLWKDSMYYDCESPCGELNGYENKTWLVNEAKDVLLFFIQSHENTRILHKILS